MTKTKTPPETEARIQTTVRIPASTMERLKSEASQKGMSINEVITLLLHQGLEAESPHALPHNPRYR